MRHAFETALDDAEREGAEPEDATPAPPPRRVVDLPTTFAPMEGGASHSLWEFAAEWTPEADPPPEPPPQPEPPRPSARPEDIAGELELAALLSPADVARARRRFMWDNHPDRRKDLDRALANARVATANMLLDRALAALMRRRRR